MDTCNVFMLWVHTTCYAAQCTVCTKGALLCPFTKCVDCVWDVVCCMHGLLLISMMMTSSSFTTGKGPFPDDVACALGTCVVAMTQLRTLRMHDLSLPENCAREDRTT